LFKLNNKIPKSGIYCHLIRAHYPACILCTGRFI